MARSLNTVPARIGYDLAAADFGDWHWVSFWKANEAPIVRAWLDSLNPGLGLDAGGGTGAYLRDAYDRGHLSASIDVSLEMLRTEAPLLLSTGGRVLRVQGDVGTDRKSV